MKAITLSLLMLALAVPTFAQTPGGPVGPAAQPQSAAPVETPSPAPSAPTAPAESLVAADNAKIVVPGDTTIPMILMNTINTRSAFVGQAIYCESIYPITVGNHIIIPKGSSIRGTVTEVVRPGHVKRHALIGLRFDELILPNGTTRHLRATLSGFGSEGDDKFNPKEGKIEGGGSEGQTRKKYSERPFPAPKSGPSWEPMRETGRRGWVLAAAIGAAAGVGWILATRGKEMVLPHGTSLELQLLQPVNFDRDEVEPPSRYDAGPAIPRPEYGPRN